MELLQIGRTWRITRLYNEPELKELAEKSKREDKMKRLLAEANLNEKISINQRKFLLMAEIRDILQTARENSKNPEDLDSTSGLAVDFTFPQLDDLLGLVNEKFNLPPQGGREEEKEVEEFCSDVRNKNKEVSLSLCESVVRSGLASGYKTVAVKFGEDTQTQIVPAEELWKILDIEIDVFKALGVSGKQEIHLQGIWRDFIDKRAEILRKSYDITSICGVFVFFTSEKICNWFLENNARIYHRKERLRFELNRVNITKLENYMKKEYYDSLVGVRKIKMTVPKLEGFSGVYDSEGLAQVEEIETEIKVKAKPENFLERRSRLLTERVWVGEPR